MGWPQSCRALPQASSHSHCINYKNTANNKEEKTTTINDRADSHNDVCQLSLKVETHLKKKLNLMEGRGKLFMKIQDTATKHKENIQKSLKPLKNNFMKHSYTATIFI